MNFAGFARYCLAWVCIGIIVISACAPTPHNSYIDNPLGSLYIPPADATLTPTPFQPLPVTPIFLPTDYPTPDPNFVGADPGSIFGLTNTWDPYPGPSVYPPIEIPPPMPLFSKPADQVNILVMGSDQRPYDGGFRTDVLLLITLNPADSSVRITSFPRDLFVYIPGWTMQRINTTQARGGIDSTALMLEYNFGVRPDHWVLINFSGFISVIDGLGGIEVQVAQTLTDWRDGYGDHTVNAGSVHMDGDTALWYVRSRGTTNDFDRTRRQQEVLQAIFFRVISLDGVTRAPELYAQYQTAMQTDMAIEDILPLLPLATQIAANQNILRFTIGPAQISDWTNPFNGAQVLLPDQVAISELMQQALNSP